MASHEIRFEIMKKRRKNAREKIVFLFHYFSILSLFVYVDKRLNAISDMPKSSCVQPMQASYLPTVSIKIDESKRRRDGKQVNLVVSRFRDFTVKWKNINKMPCGECIVDAIGMSIIDAKKRMNPNVE